MTITLADTFNRIAEKIEGEESIGDWTPMQFSDSKDEKEKKKYWDKLKADPKLFMNDVLGVGKLWTGQEQVLSMLASHSQVAVPSGHSLGKDFISARSILWFLYTHMPATVIATAPTDRQVEKVIWGELEEGYHKAHKVLPGRLITKEITVDPKRRWYAMGFTTKDVHRSPGKFQGFHNENVLLVFSEAQAIERPIWDQAESLMTAGTAKWLAIGNPLINFGPFFEACQDRVNWATVQLDCEKNPNYIQRKIVVPGLATYEWVEKMAQKHGRNSTTYKSKVKGLFPTTTTEAFINSIWVEWAANMGADSVQKTGVRVMGVDLAGPGSDKTVITIRDGMRVVEVRKYSQEMTEIWKEGVWTQENRGLAPHSTMDTADEIAGLLRAGVHRCYMDVGGLGIPVYDRLVQVHLKEKVVPINFGGHAAEDAEGREKEENKNLKPRERYRNLVTQLYANYAKILENRQSAIPNDPELHKQLVSRKMFELTDGRKILESKKDYMARGFDSPDEADSLVMCFADVEPREVTRDSFVEVQEDEGGYAGLWGQ